MVRPISRAAETSRPAPTAEAFSYLGRSKFSLLASRATLPPSSSTAVNSGMALADCKSASMERTCWGRSIFLPNITIPPTGYRVSVPRMASVTQVAPGASGSSICRGSTERSRASGRTRKSCPTFCSSVSSESICSTPRADCCASRGGAAVACAGADAAAPQAQTAGGAA